MMNQTRSVLLVTAMRREAAGIRHGAVALGAGARAGEALQALLRDRRPAAIVIAGVCGGLDPSLAAGDLLLARRVLAGDGAELIPRRTLFEAARGELLRGGVGFVSSALLTLEGPAGNGRERTDLWNAHGAGGVDMETYAMARAAEEHGVPWLALRAVVDPVRDGLPPPLRAWNGESDADVVRAALRRPLEWAAYARLAFAMRRAMRSLRSAAPGVVRAAERSAAGAGTEVPARGSRLGSPDGVG
jgi:adenosylhomocysteine nucleosidase